MTDTAAVGRPAGALDPARYGAASPLHPVAAAVVRMVPVSAMLIAMDAALNVGTADAPFWTVMIGAAVAVTVIGVPLEARRQRLTGGRSAARAMRTALASGVLPDAIDDQVWARALWARWFSLRQSRVLTPLTGLLAAGMLGWSLARQHHVALVVAAVVVSLLVAGVATAVAHRDLRRVDALLAAGQARTS